jgi:hypothetical protein
MGMPSRRGREVPLPPATNELSKGLTDGIRTLRDQTLDEAQKLGGYLQLSSIGESADRDYEPAILNSQSGVACLCA